VLDRLKSYDVDSIALVQYEFADSRANNSLGGGGMERTEDIEAIPALAQQRGIRGLLKPQLWMRGGFSGNLDFADPPPLPTGSPSIASSSNTTRRLPQACTPIGSPSASNSAR
jgi:hypothetical protein